MRCSAGSRDFNTVRPRHEALERFQALKLLIISGVCAFARPDFLIERLRPIKRIVLGSTNFNYLRLSPICCRKLEWRAIGEMGRAVSTLCARHAFSLITGFDRHLDRRYGLTSKLDSERLDSGAVLFTGESTLF